MSWRESSPVDRELTREEIEQMHTAKEEKIQAVEAKIQAMQAELLVLEKKILQPFSLTLPIFSQLISF